MAPPVPPPVPASGASETNAPLRHRTAWEYVKEAYPVVGERYGDGEGRATTEPINSAVRQLGALAPVNQLILSTNRKDGAPQAFGLGSGPSIIVCNLKAALVQATGQPQPRDQACTKCIRLDGLWVGCVRAPAAFPDVIPKGGCANCMYNNHTSRCKPEDASLYTMTPPYPPVLPAAAPTSGPASVSTADAPAADAVSGPSVLEGADRTAEAASVPRAQARPGGSTAGAGGTDGGQPSMSGTEEEQAGDKGEEKEGERCAGSSESNPRRAKLHRLPRRQPP